MLWAIRNLSMNSYIVRNARTLLGDRNTARRYCRWLACRMLGSTPKANLAGIAKVGFWKNFSEYNYYSDGITQSEYALIRGCFNNAQAEAIAFDVGANIGLFTCYMGRLGFKQVHAFEPVPETWCRLRKNVAENDLAKQVFSSCVAIGENSGFLTLDLNDAAPGLNGLALRGASSGHNLTVPSESLDVYCDRFEISRIHFMKIDVEGMELYVLNGARKLLTSGRIDTVLIEVCPRNLLRVGIRPADLYDAIVKMGLSAYRLGAGGELTGRFSKLDFERFSSENVVLRGAHNISR